MRRSEQGPWRGITGGSRVRSRCLRSPRQGWGPAIVHAASRTDPPKHPVLVGGDGRRGGRNGGGAGSTLIEARADVANLVGPRRALLRVSDGHGRRGCAHDARLADSVVDAPSELCKQQGGEPCQKACACTRQQVMDRWIGGVGGWEGRGAPARAAGDTRRPGPRRGAARRSSNRRRRRS